MKIKTISGYSLRQVHLHMALEEAVSAYRDAYAAVASEPLLNEETVTPALMALNNTLERRRITVIVLAACSVEAVANLYLAHKTKPKQFAKLDKEGTSRQVDRRAVIICLKLLLSKKREALPRLEAPSRSSQQPRAPEGGSQPRWRHRTSWFTSKTRI